MNDLELMRAHIDALFTHDDSGRIVRVNEPDGKRAPRFFLGSTAVGHEARYRDDVSPELIEALEAARVSEQPSMGDDSPTRSSDYHALLASAASVASVWSGPAYYFPRELPTTDDTMIVTRDSIDVLDLHFRDWLVDVPLRQPFLAVVKHGAAVAVCCSVRITPVAHEAGLETAPAFRRQGFGARVTAAWASVVRDRGGTPLYSTSWENTASRAVASRLGLIQYGSDFGVT